MDSGLEYLNKLTWDYRASRILQVCAKLKLFTYLSGKTLGLDDIASLCGAKPVLLEKVLTVCCAMDLLQKQGDLYANTDISDQYLVQGKPLYQGNIIVHAANFWNDLPNEILLESSDKSDEYSHRDFILGMENITMAGRGQLFIESVDLSGRKKLFDVGGGPGTYSILACKEYPGLTATVFDVPETIAITKEVLERQQMLSCISVKEGSWETDDFDQDNDVVLLSNILHGATDQAQMKLAKAYDSLVPGGMVVVQDFLLNDTKTGPMIPALFNVMVGAYSQWELFDVIMKAGFEDVKVVASSEQIGCTWVTATKPIEKLTGISKVLDMIKKKIFHKK